MHTLEKLIDILLNKAEQLEERMKEESNLKNLTTRQLTCIECIHTLKNPTLSELAEVLHITKPSASVMLERLEEHSFVRRVRSDIDRRSAHVHLTTKGDQAAQLHRHMHERFAQHLAGNLTSSEKDILVVLLNKAITSLN